MLGDLPPREVHADLGCEDLFIDLLDFLAGHVGLQNPVVVAALVARDVRAATSLEAGVGGEHREELPDCTQATAYVAAAEGVIPGPGSSDLWLPAPSRPRR